MSSAASMLMGKTEQPGLPLVSVFPRSDGLPCQDVVFGSAPKGWFNEEKFSREKGNACAEGNACTAGGAAGSGGGRMRWSSAVFPHLWSMRQVQAGGLAEITDELSCGDLWGFSHTTTPPTRWRLDPRPFFTMVYRMIRSQDCPWHPALHDHPGECVKPAHTHQRHLARDGEKQLHVNVFWMLLIFLFLTVFSWKKGGERGTKWETKSKSAREK